MPFRFTWKDSNRSTRGKVLLAFAGALIAIFLSWALTRVVFMDIAGSMRQMAAPNEKLAIVNRLLEQVTRLDQLQRVQALKKPQKTRSFLLETQHIRKTLDTLYQLSLRNSDVRLKLDSMRLILDKRDRVYVDYLKLRSEQRSNEILEKRIRTLSSLVQANAKLSDRSVVSTEQHIVTTAIPKAENEEELSFFKRLFGKKKKTPEKEFVTEESTHIRIDTLTSAPKDSMANEIELSMKKMQQEQFWRNNSLLYRELKLIRNGNSLVNGLWVLLHRIQEDELRMARAQTDTALSYIDESINRTGIMLLCFFLLISTLVYFILTDISRSNRYRKQLQDAKEHAEHLSAVKQRFLSNMSHEIRTPLQSIIGFSEQVKSQKEPDRKMLTAIYSSAGHLLQIVNEVLDYSRITAGKLTLEKHAFNPSAAFTEVADNMRFQAEQKSLQFHFSNRLPGELYYNGDDFRLKQVLYNLLGNAIKFTEHGKVEFEAETTAGDALRIIISDTGMGISEEDIQRIFNEFEQTDNSITRKFGGTGLGLSIARTLVESMGGTITLSSIKGEGTRFELLIPLERTTVPVSLKQAQPEKASDYKSIRVCFIDDDPFILDLCGSIMQKHGISYACYPSAEAFLDEANQACTILFADIRLPGKSGIELVRQLKQTMRPAPLFIALTAQVLPDEREQLQQQGFDAILLKPFREHELLSYIRPVPAAPAEEIMQHPEIGIDLNNIMQMSMNDLDLVKKHLLNFVRDTRADIELLKTYWSASDTRQIIEVSHRLAGRSGQIGSRQLLQRFRAIEINLQKEEIPAGWDKELQAVLSDALQLTDEIAVFVREQLEA